MSRPSGPCGWCGTQTTSRNQTCLNCRGIETRGDWEPNNVHELAGGHWLPVNGVRYWVPFGEEPRRPRPLPFVVGNGPTLAESAGQIVAAVAITQRRESGAA